jgi:hypothetical protein
VCGPAPRLARAGALEGGWREREIARGPVSEDTGLAGGDDRAEFGRDEESAPEQAPAIAFVGAEGHRHDSRRVHVPAARVGDLQDNAGGPKLKAPAGYPGPCTQGWRREGTRRQ